MNPPSFELRESLLVEYISIKLEMNDWNQYQCQFPVEGASWLIAHFHTECGYVMLHVKTEPLHNKLPFVCTEVVRK